MTATSEIAFVSEFGCRHCATPLIGRSSGFSSWMRCPKCGRASLAPEVRIRSAPRFVPIPESPGDDLLVIGPGPELTKMTPVAVADSSEIAFDDSDDERNLGLISAVSVRRVVASTMLFLSLLMMVVALLNQSEVGVPLFGSIAVVAMILMFWPTPMRVRS